MINHNGTRMVKDGEDWHGLQTTDFKNLGWTFQTVQPWLCSFRFNQTVLSISFPWKLAVNTGSDYFCWKVGDPKDAVRKMIRNLFKLLTKIYPASKLFNYVMEGITSKNSKTRMGRSLCLCCIRCRSCTNPIFERKTNAVVIGIS